MCLFFKIKQFFILIMLGFLSVNINAQNISEPLGGSESGKELVLQKCVQCHTDSIWRDHRQDTRAWEATLYRMMGRGAIWTQEEIKSMSGFLADNFGNQSAKLKNK
jgi:hypothetical protein